MGFVEKARATAGQFVTAVEGWKLAANMATGGWRLLQLIISGVLQAPLRVALSREVSHFFGMLLGMDGH